MDELMVRNPYEEIEGSIDEEEILEIPRPSCLDMMGVEMVTEHIEEEKLEEEKPINFIPSLSDLCLQQVSV
jgi:hypothetical protein